MKAHYIVKGIVQGVGYRAFVTEVARKYGVRGFVRNLPDGDVEIFAEAQQDLLKMFENEISNYSRGEAEIYEIEKHYNESALSKYSYSDFRIEY
ncbi:MAG: acylphosphatase [Candidatus Micrarchaeia archaeon]